MTPHPTELCLAPPAGGVPLDPGHWSPFLETRPLASLLFGSRTLGQRIEAAVGAAPPPGLVVDPRFVPDLPLPALTPPLRENQGARFVNASGQLVATLRPAAPSVPGSDPGPDPGSDPGLGSRPGDSASGERTFLWPGTLLSSAWTMMAENGARITSDLLQSPHPGARPLTTPPPGVALLGSYPVTVEEDVRVDPQVVLDARTGPIHLARGVVLRAFTHLEGPAWIGPETRVLGGLLSEVSVGPVCRVRGEISSSILQGWCNKAHDGYLGHAILGTWVNLGALTTNSDLKNTYGSVRVALDAHRSEDTGLLKVGVLLGDHVKTGIGTLLNTGTVVGAGSTLLAGGEGPPRWVPPFSWRSGGTLVPARLDATLQVAERAMARRNQVLSDEERATLTRLWEATHGSTPGVGDDSGAHPTNPESATRRPRDTRPE